MTFNRGIDEVRIKAVKIQSNRSYKGLAPIEAKLKKQMNKILYAILGLTTLVNGIRIAHIIEDEAAAMAAAEADANADAMAGADADAGAGADAGADDAADEDNDHHDDCGCGCDGCCGGNDVNIDI